MASSDPIHLFQFRLRKTPNLHVLAIGAIVGFGIALLTFLISYIGGEQYIRNLGGNFTLGVLVAGLAASFLFERYEHSEGQDEGPE